MVLGRILEGSGGTTGVKWGDEDVRLHGLPGEVRGEGGGEGGPPPEAWQRSVRFEVTDVDAEGVGPRERDGWSDSEPSPQWRRSWGRTKRVCASRRNSVGRP